jgi:hypothetical protein
MNEARRIGHATFKTPDLGIGGLMLNAKEKVAPSWRARLGFSPSQCS